MTLKLRHVAVFFFALFLGAVAMYIDIAPWLRVLVAAFLLVPIIYAADGLGIAQMLNVPPDRRVRQRRFGVLRSEVKQLLDVVRRLNWLNFDLERGVRKDDVVKAEIASAERRLREILNEIRSAAGRSSTGEEFDEDWEGDGGLEDGGGEEWEEQGEGEGALESDRA
jgi:hypothetical protein